MPDLKKVTFYLFFYFFYVPLTLLFIIILSANITDLSKGYDFFRGRYSFSQNIFDIIFLIIWLIYSWVIIKSLMKEKKNMEISSKED